MKNFTFQQMMLLFTQARLFVLSGVLLCTAFVLQAQQESQYTFFMQNEQYYNPAAAGARGVASLTALARQQWIGFEGAPSSQMLSFSAPVFNESVGFGLQLNHARKGIIDNTYAAMSYNYRLKLSDENAIRLGLQGSLQRWAVDFSDPSVRLQTVDDNSISNNNSFRTLEGNVGLGAYLELSDYLTAGVGVPQLYNSQLSVDETKGTEGARVSPHIYFTAAGQIPLTNLIDFKPSVLVKVVEGAPISTDVNFGFAFNNKILAGLGYRTGGEGLGDSFDVMGFFQVTDRFGVGGAYGFGLSDLAQQSSGSFEFIGRFEFGSQREDLVNPRFFN